MMAQDYMYQISQLEKRIQLIESEFIELKKPAALENQDWDNATLLRQWGICERTAANYRKQGLGFFKRGGRIFYSSESRNAFKNRRAAI